MKKTIFILSTALILISCTSNDEGLDVVNTTLKKPATMEHGRDTTFDLTTYNYDTDGRLLSWVDSSKSFTHEYSYDGEKFSAINVKFGNGNLHSRSTYEYQVDLLVKSLHYDFDNELVYTTTHEYDGIRVYP